MHSGVSEPDAPCWGIIWASGDMWANGNNRLYRTARGAAQAKVNNLEDQLAVAKRVFEAVRGLQNEHVASWRSTSTHAGQRAEQPLALFDDAPAEVRERFKPRHD